MANSASQILANLRASASVYKTGLGSAVGQSSLLEQKFAVIVEANTDKQTEAAQEGGMLVPINSQEVALKFGYGSLAHLSAITLLDELSVGVEVKYFFVPESGTGTATLHVITGTGTTVTKTGTLVLNVNDKQVVVGLVKDDTLAEVLAKIKTEVNANINLPVSVTTASPTTFVSVDTKWIGQSSADINVSVASNTSEGITFATVKTDGTGQVLPTTQLAKFKNDWYVHILNGLGNGISDAILDEYETFIGTAALGSGKYAPDNMTPAVAWTATSESVLGTLTDVTSGRLDSSANVYVPVPNSLDIPFINACNVAGIFAKISNGDPKQDILGVKIPSSTPPEDGNVGDIIDLSFRDTLVKAGCSTVNFIEGNYVAQDIVTTYYPLGESDPIFAYVRDNMIVFNILYAFKAYNATQMGKTIAPNAQASATVTSPKLYLAGVLTEIVAPFVALGYIADADVAKAQLNVAINESNSGRIDVLSPLLITSLLRIIAVNVPVNKYYGN
jgi:phage tail sheath gpL-like